MPGPALLTALFWTSNKWPDMWTVCPTCSPYVVPHLNVCNFNVNFICISHATQHAVLMSIIRSISSPYLDTIFFGLFQLQSFCTVDTRLDINFNTCAQIIYHDLDLSNEFNELKFILNSWSVTFSPPYITLYSNLIGNIYKVFNSVKQKNKYIKVCGNRCVQS